jgi:hypothetical protein
MSSASLTGLIATADNILAQNGVKTEGGVKTPSNLHLFSGTASKT